MRPKLDEILQAHVADVPDPRQLRSEDHPLIKLLVIAWCAVLCGAEHYIEMEAFGQATEPWLGEPLDLCRGIPSPETFNRVFRLLDPEAFAAVVCPGAALWPS